MSSIRDIMFRLQIVDFLLIKSQTVFTINYIYVKSIKGESRVLSFLLKDLNLLDSVKKLKSFSK